MLVLETIAKMRRAYFSSGKSIKEICRELCVSRKVVRKVIRSNATEFRYERSHQPLPRIGPWRERLDTLLDENDRKSARERLTLIRLFEEIQGFGYEGSYAAAQRYAIAWRRERSSATAAAFVPLSFAPGEAYRFDWSHEDRRDEWRDDHGEGRAYAALPQPDVHRARLSAGDAGDGVNDH